MVASPLAEPSSAAASPLAANPFTLGYGLAVVATALLVFVSVGVIYLSTVEWRDRRRRGSPSARS